MEASDRDPMSSPREIYLTGGTGHERTRILVRACLFRVLCIACINFLCIVRALDVPGIPSPRARINSRKRVRRRNYARNFVSRIERKKSNPAKTYQTRANNCARREFSIVCTRHVLAQRYIIKENNKICSRLGVLVPLLLSLLIRLRSSRISGAGRRSFLRCRAANLNPRSTVPLLILQLS